MFQMIPICGIQAALCLVSPKIVLMPSKLLSVIHITVFFNCREIQAVNLCPEVFFQNIRFMFTSRLSPIFTKETLE